MISSMQPSRPRLPQTPTHPPLNQQPTRQISAQYQPPTAPRSQMEAMPPFTVMRNVPAQGPAQNILDAAKRHPVFFTDRLMKAPTGVSAEEGIWTNPVAKGYIFNDGPGRKEGGVKL